MEEIRQGTEAWKLWRRQGIGASEIAAIIGVSPYSTAYQVWLEKSGIIDTFKGNFATDRGTELEGKARALYELVCLEDAPPALAVHPKYEMLRASLDGMRADGKLIVEIKCPGEESHNAALAGKVPEHYKPQVQFQLAVTGAEMCHYFSYREESYALVEVTPDIEYQGFLVNEALKFWDLVKSKKPPLLTDKDAKWSDDETVLIFFEELLKVKDDKQKREIWGKKITDLAEHPKVLTKLGRVTSVQRNGKHSYFKVTENKGEK